MSVWLLENRHGTHETHGKPGFSVRFQGRFEKLVDWTVARRRVVGLAYLLATGAVVLSSAWGWAANSSRGSTLGRCSFGFCSLEGTHYEVTPRVAHKDARRDRRRGRTRERRDHHGLRGGPPPPSSRSTWRTSGRGGPNHSNPSIRPAAGKQHQHLRLPGKAVRAAAPKVGAWFKEELLRLGLTPQQADRRVADMIFAFEPGDLISETMSLGAPAPIEVVVTGRNLADSSAYMDKLRSAFTAIPLRDVQIQQSLHYPTVQVTVDRERAGLSGVTARDVGESLIAATYSSRYTSRNYWRDDISGNSYQVQVQVPQPKMTAATDVEIVPLTTAANRQQAAQNPAPLPTPRRRS